ADEAPNLGPGVEVVDAGGTTAVAGMVDAHSHLTLPGGSHWIDRAADPTDRLPAVAEDNARLPRPAGGRWGRELGRPARDGGTLTLTVRDRWRGRPGYPYVRAAGCWLTRAGSLPAQLPVEVSDGGGLLRAALCQPPPPPSCRSRSPTATGSSPPPSASSTTVPTWSSCTWTGPTATPRRSPPARAAG